MNTDEQNAVRIIETLHEAGHTAYLVGGYVRDRVRGKSPEDFDIATDAGPDRVRELFPRTIPVGVSFGVVLVIMDGTPYEVATFRSDLGYSNGRHPDAVKFGGPEEDARRRDFTINGMFYDPVKDEVIDYVGGREDIENRLIRAIGDPEERFAEDKLRMLRAVRFAAKLDFQIDPETTEAIEKHAPEILGVSFERIREELGKILTDRNPRRGIELASDLGLLRHILPEVEQMKGVRQPEEFHPEGDVWTHTMLALEIMEKEYPRPSVELAMAVLLHDVGKPPTYKEKERIRFDRHSSVGAEMAEKIIRRLRFSKNQQELVVAMVRDHQRFMQVRDMRKSTLKKFLRLENFDLHLKLHRIDCLASHSKLDNYDYVLEKLEEFKSAGEEQLRPTRLLDGNDLIEMGLEPGPRFGKILNELEDAQLEGSITTRDEAIEFVRRVTRLNDS